MTPPIRGRFHQANPDTHERRLRAHALRATAGQETTSVPVDGGLIQALQKAGIAIHVWSYAFANAKIECNMVASGVTVDLAAMISLANFQLQRWALIQGSLE